MKTLILALTVMTLLCQRHADAWHRNGHMGVARIAWEQMTDAQRQKATEILNQHPHKTLFLESGKPAGVAMDEWCFVQAATWPDWVRDPHGPGLSHEQAKMIRSKYHKGPWHFINLPYVHPDETATFDEAAIRNSALQPSLDAHGSPRNALVALQKSLDQLGGTNVPAEDQAVALCWVLHLIGDIQQPLHAATLIASKEKFPPGGFLPPGGDEGGNSVAVKIQAADQKAIELHTYWDALLLETLSYAQVKASVLDWIHRPQLGRDAFQVELQKHDFLDWANESYGLAKTAAYAGNNGLLDFLVLAPGEHQLLGLNAPVLPQGYQDQAEGVARRQMVLGGYRLADQLGTVLGN
jgi:hypothetical protein